MSLRRHGGGGRRGIVTAVALHRGVTNGHLVVVGITA